MALKTLEIRTTSLFLHDNGAITAAPTGLDIRERITGDPGLGKIMVNLAIGHDARPTRWEMHPAGDEVLLVLQGELSVVFEDTIDGSEGAIARDGQAVIVPKGLWHRIQGPPGWQVLCITYAAGTVFRVA